MDWPPPPSTNVQVICHPLGVGERGRRRLAHPEPCRRQEHDETTNYRGPPPEGRPTSKPCEVLNSQSYFLFLFLQRPGEWALAREGTPTHLAGTSPERAGVAGAFPGVSNFVPKGFDTVAAVVLDEEEFHPAAANIRPRSLNPACLIWMGLPGRRRPCQCNKGRFVGRGARLAEIWHEPGGPGVVGWMFWGGVPCSGLESSAYGAPAASSSPTCSARHTVASKRVCPVCSTNYQSRRPRSLPPLRPAAICLVRLTSTLLLLALPLVARPSVPLVRIHLRTMDRATADRSLPHPCCRATHHISLRLVRRRFPRPTTVGVAFGTKCEPGDRVLSFGIQKRARCVSSCC